MTETIAPTVGEILERRRDEAGAPEAGNSPMNAQTPIEAAPEAKGSVIGDNGAPAFDTIKSEIEDLYAEAKNWLDGEPIASDEQAAEIAKLRDMIRSAGKRAEEQRKAEAKPFDDGKAEVQGRYNPLVQKDRGKVDLAIAACNSAMAPWLKKKDDEQRAAAEEARRVAEDAARAARDAARVAADSGDLSQRERAEDLLSQAKTSVNAMLSAEKARPQIVGGARAVGMKTIYHPELTDPAAAIEHYRKAQPGALKEWMLEQACKDVRAGPKPPAAIPGFTFREEQVPA